MKKNISILLILALITSFAFTSCGANSDKQNNFDKAQATILNDFDDISKIPRNNGDDMSQISKYITDKAKEIGLSSHTDAAGNILIEKPAAKGYGKAPVTILQTNMDMVVKSAPSIIFNPKKDGITPIINEETGTITGSHTDLGASSGLGIATALYVLEHKTDTGEIKAIFTVDGCGDMSGASNIDPSFLEGDYLINLNNEKAGDIQIGSAYSSVMNAVEKTQTHDTQNKYSFVMVADDFTGGDSGVASQNKQGNPIIFLADVLAQVKTQGLTYELNDIQGGDSPTEIPKSAKAVITVNDYEKSKVSSIFEKVKKDYLNKYDDTDPNAKFEILETTVPGKAIDNKDVDSLISYLYGVIDGKYIDKDKSTASSNVCTVKIKNSSIVCGIFLQSKIEAALDKMISDHKQIAKISNISLTQVDYIDGYYIAKKSALPTGLTNAYKSILNENAKTSYKTSRTELGFFLEKNDGLKMVSIGPTIKDDEQLTENVELSTVAGPALVIIEFLSGLTGLSS